MGVNSRLGVVLLLLYRKVERSQLFESAIVVPLTNVRQRQTYHGALNLLTQDFHLQESVAGNGKTTVAYIE